jgi:hypothetical protein
MKTGYRVVIHTKTAQVVSVVDVSEPVSEWTVFTTEPSAAREHGMDEVVGALVVSARGEPGNNNTWKKISKIE